MKEQLIETWTTHNHKNLMLIAALPPSALERTLSERGGRTIGQQLIHVHNVRLQWLEVCAVDIFRKYNAIDKESKPGIQQLGKSFTESGAGIIELLARGWDAGGIVKGFKKGVLPLLGYFIAHESHHRGNIMLTLKQIGEKLPDKVKWGLWEWVK
jgi:uncharacterized damage-inducible protein DinB